ncbi:hypothetical protein A946_03920 [Methylacidiphilum kamchatkense Kam1]|uniref:FtsK/SpoIIIE family protein n=1 Tax=Methylacidiphilum kamchatkense Kam1 TaxID=1202785 RepID=A0A0C1V5Z3_9BACT|nr:PD-(D/E)XK nuclease family protein [Methylacidiphilum kamchatkense]KIE59160.1 hypothetical protein A946_03920 [Methylacidiphilum kamchatkense Kam1]QDQ42913.1 FtsK/SpoIIIE family protein [Methylacidiphilum kamchatkense Kam1]
MNPFEEQIVKDPRVLPDPPLSGLNERPLIFLLKKFEELGQKKELPKAYLLSSPEAGFGKTYLIGRLFQELKGKATLIYFYAIIDPHRFWINIFDRILTELSRPEEFINKGNNRSYTQFEIYTSRIIGNLLADLINDKLIEPQELIQKSLVRRVSNEFEVVEALRNAPNQKADFSNPSEKWIQWMQASYWDSLAHCCENALYKRGIDIGELYKLIPLFWIFFWYSANHDQRHREKCIEWLTGESLEEEDAKEIGLPTKYIKSLDSTVDDRNDLCWQRVCQFCNLASFARPFVFCFDQTERYGEDESLCRQFGSVIGSLVNECKNHLTILTTNSYDWEIRHRNYIHKANLDRIAYEKQLELEGLNRDQAIELIKQRMRRYPIEESKYRKLLEELPSFFSSQTKVGIRKFLQWAEQRLKDEPNRDDGPKGNDELEKIFNEEKKKFLSGQVIFQPDLFLEAIQSALFGKKESVQQIKHDYYSVCWQNEGHQITIYFGCDKSDNWKRWGAIAKKTLELFHSFQAERRRFLGVFLRSPELKEIPGKNWKATKEKETIDKAKKEGRLRIEAFDKDKTAEFYALAILYRNAISRDITYSKEEVEEFVSKKLSSWIDSLVASSSPPPQITPLPQPPLPTLTNGIEVTVSWIIDKISSNESLGPEKQPDSNLGDYFHKIIADISKEAKASHFIRPDELLKRLKEIIQDKIKGDIRAKGDLKKEEKRFLEEALYAFYKGLPEELARCDNRIDHLFWEIEKDIYADYVKKDSKKIKIIGRIDRLSKTTANAIELVDYKISRYEPSTENIDEKDKLQLALYSWMLKQSGQEPTRISLAYFHPNRKVIELNKNELERLFNLKIVTVLERIAINGNEPYKNYIEKLNEFFSKNKIDAKVSESKTAPQFIRFFVEKDVTVKLTNIVNRKKDIQLHLGLDVPPFIDADKNYVKIDVALPQIDCIVPWKEALKELKGDLAFPIGKTIDLEQSEWVIGDFTDSNFPHLLVAGTTGSGKSQFLKSLIGAILSKYPKKARVFLIDFKGTDFLPLKSINSHEEAENLLKQAVQANE